MAETSSYMRYRPVLLPAVSLGAVYSIYLLWTAYSRQSEIRSLQRSNAVHRARRPHQQHILDWLQPSSEAPLGVILLKRGGEVFRINLIHASLPNISTLEAMFGSNGEHICRELQGMALDMALTACFAAQASPGMRADLERLGLSIVVEAMATRDPAQVLAASSTVLRVLHLDAIDENELERAVGTLLRSERWSTDAHSDGYNMPAATDDLDIVDTVEAREPSQGLRGLLYYIAEEDAKRKAYEHRGIACEGCGQVPIEGIRYHCLNCPDFDLCASCEAHSRHPKTHVFAKIKIPLPVLSQPTKEYRLWYAGDPRVIHPSIEPMHKKHLCQESGFEEAQIDAFYDQFVCTANTPWDNESSVKWAIDRSAFDQALTSERWPVGLASNALFDRIFAFYDTDSNGLIGFEEFVSGLAYLRGPTRFASLQRCLQGYDLNGDGYIDRADFLRLLRAKFVIQKQLIDDAIQAQEAEQTLNGMNTLRSSQPISSIFSEELIPPGQIRQPAHKRMDEYGDLVPKLGREAILDDDAPFTERGLADHEQLRRNLSRFEELIYGPGGELDPNEADLSVDPIELSPGSNDAPSRPMHVTMRPSDVGDEAEVEEPFVQDLLWHITEEGISSLLDPLFTAREKEDQWAISTRAERGKWRKEIDSEKHSKKLPYEEAKTGASPEQTSATVASRYDSDSDIIDEAAAVADINSQFASVTFSDSVVPTDWHSLERREAEISDAPLGELLETIGYSIREDDETHPSFLTSAERIDENSSGESYDDVSSIGLTFNDLKKISPATSEQNSSSAADTEQCPNKTHLRRLAWLDQVEKNMNVRGAPGRLSIDEAETHIVTASRGDLRGLVKSWLEWASF